MNLGVRGGKGGDRGSINSALFSCGHLQRRESGVVGRDGRGIFWLLMWILGGLGYISILPRPPVISDQLGYLES